MSTCVGRHVCVVRFFWHSGGGVCEKVSKMPGIADLSGFNWIDFKPFDSAYVCVYKTEQKILALG